jgi:hypothetical protein
LPRRASEVLDGGSLYWIIKGQIRVRQRILGLDPGVDGEGRQFCLIRFDADLVETMPVPSRPMQGWRYLEDAEAPPDQGAGAALGSAMPAAMVHELRLLGLL